jgi:hypothetical protein
MMAHRTKQARLAHDANRATHAEHMRQIAATAPAEASAAQSTFWCEFCRAYRTVKLPTDTAESVYCPQCSHRLKAGTTTNAKQSPATSPVKTSSLAGPSPAKGSNDHE